MIKVKEVKILVMIILFLEELIIEKLENQEKKKTEEEFKKINLEMFLLFLKLN